MTILTQSQREDIEERYKKCIAGWPMREEDLPQLHQDRAALLASEKALREQLERYEIALNKLARLGNGDMFGNSDGNVIAQQALEQSDD